jgi:hypothetical protein
MNSQPQKLFRFNKVDIPGSYAGQFSMFASLRESDVQKSVTLAPQLNRINFCGQALPTHTQPCLFSILHFMQVNVRENQMYKYVLPRLLNFLEENCTGIFQQRKDDLESWEF